MIVSTTEKHAVKWLALTFMLVLVPGVALGAGSKSQHGGKSEEAMVEKMLMKIDPSERFIQICSFAAAEHIAEDKNPYKPDRAVMDSISPAKIDGDKMTGSGAAFRSHGDWYQFSFKCETSPDHMKVLSFNYQVGDKIPEGKWEDLGLWK
jgi:hypothetical protein